MRNIEIVVGLHPVALPGGGRHARGNRQPDIAHMHAAEHVLGNVRDIDIPVATGGDQRLVMQRFAIDQRAVDIPGHCTYRHDVPFGSRSATAG